MKESTVLILGLLLPPMLLVLIAGPLYAGCYGGLYWLYGAQVADQALSVDYQIGAYQQLITFAAHHPVELGFWIPAFLPPVAGLIAGLWFFVLLARFVRSLHSG